MKNAPLRFQVIEVPGSATLSLPSAPHHAAERSLKRSFGRVLAGRALTRRLTLFAPLPELVPRGCYLQRESRLIVTGDPVVRFTEEELQGISSLASSVAVTLSSSRKRLTCTKL